MTKTDERTDMRAKLYVQKKEEFFVPMFKEKLKRNLRYHMYGRYLSICRSSFLPRRSKSVAGPEESRFTISLKNSFF